MSSQDTRKNLKITTETYDILEPDKGDESWDEYLRSLHDGAPKTVETSDISDEQMERIINRTAEEVVRRVETMLP